MVGEAVRSNEFGSRNSRGSLHSSRTYISSDSSGSYNPCLSDGSSRTDQTSHRCSTPDHLNIIPRECAWTARLEIGETAQIINNSRILFDVGELKCNIRCFGYSDNCHCRGTTASTVCSELSGIGCLGSSDWGFIVIPLEAYDGISAYDCPGRNTCHQPVCDTSVSTRTQPKYSRTHYSDVRSKVDIRVVKWNHTPNNWSHRTRRFER